MSPGSTWLATRSRDLRAALVDLGLTITDIEAQKILDAKLSELSTLMRVSRHDAQQDFTDEHLAAFAQSLALSFSDEAPETNLIDFERTISMPVAAVGLTTATLAEALKVAHINLSDKSTAAGLSLLSALGMICADANELLVSVPRLLLLRIARYLDTAAASITGGDNLPDGLDEANRRHFANILAMDADGIRNLSNTDGSDMPTLWRAPSHSDGLVQKNHHVTSTTKARQHNLGPIQADR